MNDISPENLHPEIKAASPFAIEMHGTSVPRNEGSPNEDSILFDVQQGFGGVFDGIGGELGGANASQLAKKSLTESLSAIRSDENSTVAAQMVSDALYSASKKILSELQYGKTTATVFKIVTHNGQRELVLGHVGNSRAYLVRNDTLIQLTIDHYAYEKDKGTPHDHYELQQQAGKSDQLTQIQSEYPLRQVLGKIALGESLTPDIYIIPLQEDDRIILTSDAIPNNLLSQQIQNLVIQNAPDQVADILIKAAQEKRNNLDDSSVVIMELNSEKAREILASVDLPHAWEPLHFGPPKN